jgi:hypothetical protein
MAFWLAEGFQLEDDGADDGVEGALAAGVAFVSVLVALLAPPSLFDPSELVDAVGDDDPPDASAALAGGLDDE